MFLRRFVVGGLLALLVLGSLGGMRRNNYSSGYEAGFLAGQQAAAVASEAPKADSAEAPKASAAESEAENGRSRHGHHGHYYGHGHYGHGWGFSPFAFFIGGLFKFFFFFMLMGMIFKFFGFRRWRHGHRPPWHKGPGNDEDNGDSTYEKQPEDVEPDIRSA